MNRTETNRALAKALAYADCGKFDEAQHWGEVLLRALESAAVFRAGSVRVDREPLAPWPPLPEIVPIRTKLASLTPHPATRRQTIQDSRDFNEADCGGVFDGNQVISDADSGL